jgi:galactonate dehydratase
MEIVDVTSYVLGDLHYVVLRTDDGLVGLGQSTCWAYPAAVHAVIEAFRPYLLGQDPRRIEHHHQRLYRMGPFRGSVLSAAVSAVDIALWDLKGKQLGVPIWELLGGKSRERVRLAMLIPLGDPAQTAERAAAAVADGFTVVKFVPLPERYYDLSVDRLTRGIVECVTAVRETVGPDVDIILEFNRRLTPLQALPILEAVKPFHPLFCEDPIQIDSLVSQAEIARRTSVPIANGERIHSVWEFRELLAYGGPQYVRPDVGLAGGFTHLRKIAGLAEAYHSAVVPHNAFGPVLTAASVHLDTVIPNFLVQEVAPMDETPVFHAFRSQMRRDGGYMIPSEAPGLGVEFDESQADPADFVNYMGGFIYNTPLRGDGSVALAV